jgi:AcrR family transcriptional regulator
MIRVSEVRVGRARPLSVEDRQAMIIEAVTPLIIEHGQQVTSQQMAAAAGIAEGTIFRAFGSKENLIKAAVDKHLDPEPFRQELRSVSADLPLEEKVAAIVCLMRARFSTVFRMVAALGLQERPPTRAQDNFARLIGELLSADLDRLNQPPERVAQVIRMVTVAASLPVFSDTLDFTEADLTSIILYGIAGEPRSPA